MLEELSLLSLLCFLLLVFILLHILIVLNPKIFKLFDLSFPLLFSLLESKVNCFLLFLFSLCFLSLKLISLIKSLLEFGNFLEFSPIPRFLFTSFLLFELMLLLHDIVKFLFFLLGLDDSLSFFSNQFLDLVIDHLFFLLISLARLFLALIFVFDLVLKMKEVLLLFF